MGNKIESSGDSDCGIYTSHWVVSGHKHYTLNKHTETHMKGVLNLLDRKVLLSRLHSTIVHNIVLRHKSLRGMALYFFRCKNLGVPLICNYIVRQFDHVILRGRYNFSADIHCYSDFPDLRHLTLRGMQQNLSKIATSTCTCREIKSSMILEENQKYDWKQMLRAIM